MQVRHFTQYTILWLPPASGGLLAFSRLARLVAREYFIEFSRNASFKSRLHIFINYRHKNIIVFSNLSVAMNMAKSGNTATVSTDTELEP